MENEEQTSGCQHQERGWRKGGSVDKKGALCRILVETGLWQLTYGPTIVMKPHRTHIHTHVHTRKQVQGNWENLGD